MERTTVMQLEGIAALSPSEIAEMEENVKLKVAVPLLEVFGHKGHLHFEENDGSGRRIDITLRGLPRDSQVIVETKAAGKRLDDYLFQIREYLRNSGALVAFITNGEEIRAYAPIQGFGIEECCIFACSRCDLAQPKTSAVIERLLLRENLVNRKTKEFVRERQDKIVETFSQMDEIKADMEAKKGRLLEDIQTAEAMIAEFRQEVDEVEKNADQKRREILESSDLPLHIPRPALRVAAEADTAFSRPITNVLKPSTLPPPPVSRVPMPNHRGKQTFDVSLRDLFEAGLIKNGQKFFRETYNKQFEVTFEAPDRLRQIQDGRAKYYDSLSGAAVDLTGTSINGWIWWRVGDPQGVS